MSVEVKVHPRGYEVGQGAWRQASFVEDAEHMTDDLFPLPGIRVAVHAIMGGVLQEDHTDPELLGLHSGGKDLWVGRLVAAAQGITAWFVGTQDGHATVVEGDHLLDQVWMLMTEQDAHISTVGMAKQTDPSMIQFGVDPLKLLKCEADVRCSALPIGHPYHTRRTIEVQRRVGWKFVLDTQHEPSRFGQGLEQVSIGEIGSPHNRG